MDVEPELLKVISRWVSPINARSLLRFAVSRSQANLQNLTPHSAASFARHLDNAATLFITDSDHRRRCCNEIEGLLLRLEGDRPAAPSKRTIELAGELALVEARSVARDVCKQLGFPETVAVRVITAVSELARNVVQYVGRGQLHFEVLTSGKPGVRIIATDHGPGIPNLEEIFAGGYRSRTGMGMGLLGTKRIMDDFQIESSPEKGTTVTVVKYLQ